MQFGTLYMSMTEWGLGDFPGIAAGPRLQVCTPFQLASAVVGLHDCGDVDHTAHSIAVVKNIQQHITTTSTAYDNISTTTDASQNDPRTTSNYS